MPEKTAAEEIEMMRDYTKWPHLFLPLKRKTRDMGSDADGQPVRDLAILLDDGPTLYFINLWNASRVRDWGEVPKKVYQDYEAIYDDGWRVD
jgi:hypothetical protein